MKRVAIIFVVLSVVLSVGLWLKVRELRAAEDAPAGSSGVIEGVQVDISARLAARVVDVRVREGEQVKKGQLLVTLDCREQQALLAAARAQLMGASSQAAAARAQVDAALGAARAASASVRASGAQRSALEASRGLSSRQSKRIKQLQGEGGATAVELDRASTQLTSLDQQLTALRSQQAAARGQAAAARARTEATRKQAEAARANIAAAKANVERVSALVDECTLRAPIAGAVLIRAREPGELALPGARLLTLIRTDPVEAVFYLPNRELGLARPGRSVTVRADTYPERRFKGVIRSVSSEAEFTARTVQTRRDRDRLVYAVTIELANADGALRAGMPVDIRIDGTGKQAAASKQAGQQAPAGKQAPASKPTAIEVTK